jgi:Protein of unknown function (DUF3347)
MIAPTRYGAAFRHAALALIWSVLALSTGGCSRGATKPADSISAPDREVLAQYEAVRAALADDDIRKAHIAGEKLLRAVDAPGVSPGVTKARNAAKALAESHRIDVSRAAFKELSAAVIPICRSVEGYFIITTDLVTDGEWAQTSRVIGNPYLGRSMALYGEIK